MKLALQGNKKLLAISGTALFGVLCFYFGVSRGEKNARLFPHSVEYGDALIVVDGKEWTIKNIKPEELAQYKELENKARERDFESRYNNFREREQFLKNLALDRIIQTEADTKKLSLENAREQVIPMEHVGRPDALALYIASDPSAPLKDFDRIEPQLAAYLTEVRRREKADEIVENLKNEDRLKLFIQEPKASHSVELQVGGYPKIGLEQSKHKVVSFVDYFCKTCVEANLRMSQLVQEFSATTQFVFIPFPYTKPEKGLAFSRGVLCADAQKRFIDFHMAAIARGEGLEKASVFDVAGDAELNLNKFKQCYTAGSGLAELLGRSQSEANRAGVLRTPVASVDGFIKHFDSVSFDEIRAILRK